MEAEPDLEPRRHPTARARGSTFRSLRVRNFRLFVAGQLVSAIGSWMHSVAAPWLVLELTGSGVALGIEAALLFLPTLVLGPWGGLIADRFDNRRLQLASQVAYAAYALALWLLVVTGAVEVWMVFALSFLAGAITAVDMPSRQSFYLEMVGREDLTNAMSLNTATFTGARMIGPALAGVLIASVGTAPVFLLNALSYLAIMAALLLMRPEELHRRERVPRGKGQVREGIRYVARTPGLRLPLLLMAVVFLFAFNFSVLLPLLAVRGFGGGARTYGTLLSLFGIGSFAGAVVMASRVRAPNGRRLARFAVALGALSTAAAVAPTLGAAIAVMAPLGAATIAFAIAGNSTLQLTSRDDMRGRVMALYTAVFLGSTPIGGPVAGWVGEHLGPRVGLAGGGIVAVVAGLATLAALRRSTIPPAET